MATLVMDTIAPPRDDRFFTRTAIAMALVIVAGFSTQLAMGRSSFAAPPLVHVHAVVFMGWVAIYLAQNMLAAGGSIALHRRLGWIAAGWMVAMVILGTAITVIMVRAGRVPFVFRPAEFLTFNPLSVLTFAGLTTTAIVMRRRADWHSRLHYCGMATLLGPGFGRLLPMPLLIPWAFEATFVASMIFPAIGVAADVRRGGRVHPAWWWGIGAMFLFLLAAEAIGHGPAGASIYDAVTKGSPGAAVPALDFAPPPATP